MNPLNSFAIEIKIIFGSVGLRKFKMENSQTELKEKLRESYVNVDEMKFDGWKIKINRNIIKND